MECIPSPLKKKCFSVLERCKSLGSLKSFLLYASQLSGASILCFTHPELPWAHCREMPVAARSQVFFWSVFRAQELTLEDCNSWSLWHYDILLYWYDRKYSISHGAQKAAEEKGRIASQGELSQMEQREHWDSLVCADHWDSLVVCPHLGLCCRLGKSLLNLQNKKEPTWA